MATTSVSHAGRSTLPTFNWSPAPSPEARAEPRVPPQPAVSRFSDAEWTALVHEDNVALSSISILLAAIIGLGALGMALVVAILAFGG
ncbi:MAG TPA: hypothetical protein VG826_34070 [Pirellulales bacterium]|nr:hypothetical protein [Pirellulales bacterium]